jgi:hypothetical protein
MPLNVELHPQHPVFIVVAGQFAHPCHFLPLHGFFHILQKKYTSAKQKRTAKQLIIKRHFAVQQALNTEPPKAYL